MDIEEFGAEFHKPGLIETWTKQEIDEFYDICHLPYGHPLVEELMSRHGPNKFNAMLSYILKIKEEQSK
jgi:hypothetical protein